MTITGIKNNVQQLLVHSGLFATDGAGNWAVITHPPESDADFIGYPAASHYYANTQSDYATVSQNRRVIEYIVELYLQTDTASKGDTEFSEAYALIDNVLNLFDQSIDLSSPTIPLSRACDILRPTPGELQRVQLGEGTGLYMPIKLYCEADISFL